MRDVVELLRAVRIVGATAPVARLAAVESAMVGETTIFLIPIPKLMVFFCSKDGVAISNMSC